MNSKVQKLSKKFVIIAILVLLNVFGFFLTKAYFVKENDSIVDQKLPFLELPTTKSQSRIVEFGLNLLQVIKK